MMSGSPSVPFRTSALLERAVRLAVQDLEQPRHVLAPCGSRSRRGCRDVRRRRGPQTVEWSWCITTRRALRPPALGLQPVAGRELAVAEILVDADLPAVELADEQVLLAVAVDVGPAGRRVAGVLDPDRHAARLESDRRLEFRGAADGESPPTTNVESNVRGMARLLGVRAEMAGRHVAGAATSGSPIVPASDGCATTKFGFR